MSIPSTYQVVIAGRSIELPVVPLSGAPLSIALFDSLGDLELCDFLAAQMVKQAQRRGLDLDAIDVLLTAGKAITLAESTARKLGLQALSMAEKRAKNFWQDAFGVPSRSITAGTQEQLVVGGRRAAMLKGKRILIVDDVISTGESMQALLKIARHFGEASLVMAPFMEGGGRPGERIDGVPAVVLGSLPVWPHG